MDMGALEELRVRPVSPDFYPARVVLTADERNALFAYIDRLRDLLAEASGQVAPDTSWSDGQPTGYLLDRIDAALHR